jgi:glycolate oxidase FAD binding subunit
LTVQTSELSLNHFSDLDCQPWESLEFQWQQKLQGAILGDTPPRYLAFPQTPDSLAAVLKFAWEQQWAVLPCGSGSKLNWGGLVKAPQLAISSQHLNKIIEHAVGDLTVTVGAGVKLATLQQTLRQANQFLPLNPAYPQTATVGGIVATADAGSWRQRYGGVRDLVLGLAFVRPDGAMAKAGGRVVKNVAGYDLSKLFIGSYGTLGMISQVTFRAYPLPEASATVVVAGEVGAIAAAAQTLRQSGLTPIASELVSAALVRRLAIGEGMGLVVRFQSIPESVAEQSAQVDSLAGQLGLQVISERDERENELWQRLSETITQPSAESAITCKIGVMPHTAVAMLAELEEIMGEQGWGTITTGNGLGRLHLEKLDSLSQLEKLRSLCQDRRGFLTLLEAPKEIKQQFEPWGYTGNALDMMRKLKEKFDPKNIMSPGRFVGGM